MKDMEKINYQKYGAYLRQKRKAAGISIKELAHQIGIALTYLSSFERGQEKVSLDYFFKALRILGVTQIDLAELYGESPAPGSAPETDPEKAKFKQMLREIISEELS